MSIFIIFSNSDKWSDDSILLVLSPLECQLSNIFYHKSRMDNNQISIKKPLLNYNDKWKISLNYVDGWLTENYDDNTWKECSFPECIENINNNNKFYMRKKLIIEENTAEIFIDILYNDSFVLYINEKVVNMFNAREKVENEDEFIQITSQHISYHDTVAVSSEYIKTGNNIICIYYFLDNQIKYDPLIELSIYQIEYNTILNYQYQMSNRILLDLIDDSYIDVKCEKGVTIPFGFSHKIIFNSFNISSSVITKDIKFKLYGLNSKNTSIILSQSYSKFDENYILYNTISSNSYYLEIEECNTIQSFTLKNIIVSIQKIKYCDNNEYGFYPVAVNQYSVIDCNKPLYGVIRCKCKLDENNNAVWDKTDDETCDYESPLQIYLENNIIMIEGYINTEIDDVKIINYTPEYYQDVYIIPDLPNGIKLDEEKGIISGNTSEIGNKEYAIIVFNKNGKKFTKFNISITDLSGVFSYENYDGQIDEDIFIKPKEEITAKYIYVYPELPLGLSISYSGIISGKIKENNKITHFYVTYVNDLGEVSTEINIIATGIPSDYNYGENKYTISQSVPFSSGNPSIRGIINVYKCESLPNGLSINSNNGVISGIPVIINKKTYKCYAINNKYGRAEVDLEFDIIERKCPCDDNWCGTPGTWVKNENLCSYETTGYKLRYCSDDETPVWGDIVDFCKLAPPTALTYPTISFYYKQTGKIYKPTYSGVIKKYEISPKLINGLFFNESNGEIWGKPMELLEEDYTITGSNENGKITTYVTIKVNDRYCETDEEWTKTLIDTSLILECENNLVGLRKRDCIGYDDYEEWDNITYHCLERSVDQYDKSKQTIDFNISFYNISYVNDIDIDYKLIEYIEELSGLYPIAYVSKKYTEIDRVVYLYIL